MFHVHKKSNVKLSVIPTNFPLQWKKEDIELQVAKLFLQKTGKKYKKIYNGDPNKNEPDILVQLNEDRYLGIELTALIYENHKSKTADYPELKNLLYEIIEELDLNLEHFHIQFILPERKNRYTIGKLLNHTSKVRKNFKQQFKELIFEILSSPKFKDSNIDTLNYEVFDIDSSQYNDLSKYLKQCIVAFPCKSFSDSTKKLPVIVFNKESINFTKVKKFENAERIISQKWDKNYSLTNVILLIYKPNLFDPFAIYEENLNMLNKIIPSLGSSPFKNIYFYDFGLQRIDQVVELV